MKYEHLKHSGELPIIGVNTFLRPEHMKAEEGAPLELMRSTEEEKQQQIANLEKFQHRNRNVSAEALKQLRLTAARDGNIFEILLNVVHQCSLGQITRTLFESGGQYRRNM